MQKKPLNGMPAYEATSTGEIIVKKTGHIKQQRLNSYGYAIVSLYENTTQKHKCVTVHSLVLLAFTGGPPEDGQRYTVDHIDRVRNNNHISNLRWATGVEQSQNSTTKTTNNSYRSLIAIDENGNCETFPDIYAAATSIENAKDIYAATSVRRIYKALKTKELEFGRFWDYLPTPAAAVGEFRPIPPAAIHGETGYFASSTGFVRTPRGYITSGCTAGGREYPVVTLVNKHEYRVHRLVAAAFLKPDEGRPWVNHINGRKSDNRLVNLEWTTARENALHAIEIGLTPMKQSTCIDRLDLNNTFDATYTSLQLAAASVCTTHYQNIRACCKGRQKTAYGYKWRYSEVLPM